MRGVVVKFDAERGFGFIRVRNREEDLFVHVSNVRGGEPLHVGQKVRFSISQTEKGPAAVDVVPGAMQRSPTAVYGLLCAVGVGGLSAAAALHGLPWLAAYLLAVNLTTLLVYGLDKALAAIGLLRVPERVLHGLAFLGGSPAGLAAQRLFRHKTAKTRFQVVYWLIVAVQVALLVIFREHL